MKNVHLYLSVQGQHLRGNGSKASPIMAKQVNGSTQGDHKREDRPLVNRRCQWSQQSKGAPDAANRNMPKESGALLKMTVATVNTELNSDTTFLGTVKVNSESQCST